MGPAWTERLGGAGRRSEVLSVLSLLLAAEAGDPLADYQRAQQALEQRRVELGASWKAHPAQARLQARAALLTYLETSAFPAWAGTPWDYYGTTTTPRSGAIACGYFVTTVLEQAGFRIERVLLAQQASSWLVASLARNTRVDWLHPSDNAAAVKEIRERFGDGLFVIGFDYHVGFLRLEGERAAFCHSSVLEPRSVTCEDPVASGAFASHLYVVANALNDPLLDDWLLGRAVPSKLPLRPRRE